jgi:flagellar basal-body rod protein FlgF
LAFALQLQRHEGDKAMRIGIYAAALGAREQQKRLEVISNNIANTDTAGYKKDVVCFHDFLVETTAPRLEQGAIQITDHPLDIALSGDGFLRAQTDRGIFYTRSGNLTVNKDGTLVTPEGWPILGKNGPISVNSTAVRITEDGQVFDNNQPVGMLDLVRFTSKGALSKVKNGYFQLDDPKMTPQAAADCSVHQGALEQANFNVVEEMTQMIDTLRTFEAYQKVLQSFDQIDSQLANKIGSPS